MLELFLRSSRGLASARSSCVGPYLDGFAAMLCEQGYSRQIAAWCITYAVHLGLWAAAEGLPIAALEDSSVDAFVAHLPRCDCPGHRAGVHAVARPRTRLFVRYLRTVGVVAVAGPQAAEPELVTGFCAWMRRHRGVAETTLRHYRPVAVTLLGYLGDNPDRYEAGDIRTAVREVTGGHGTSMARLVANVARALLRYLAVEGRCRPGLDAAILPVASTRLASLPSYIGAPEVQQIIDSCGPDRPDGARDRAILLLLARLGLRAGDIVRLCLSDIDWANARVRVTGKGRHEVRLPLPQEVGDAILAYLRERRSGAACDRVFLIARAPWGPLGGSAGVSGIVRRALGRAGVSSATRGPTCSATRPRPRCCVTASRSRRLAWCSGTGPSRRPPSTPKVDVPVLRAVAQPWIGGGPC